ncbi:hypothetical protein BC628DRAFT_1063785 [Trametes gibbosa]|nr:hypothetical protein BC628DRAFT_1063785 [Trametes gibbosa]
MQETLARRRFSRSRRASVSTRGHSHATSRSSTNLHVPYCLSSSSSCCTGAAWPPPPRFESIPFRTASTHFLGLLPFDGSTTDLPRFADIAFPCRTCVPFLLRSVTNNIARTTKQLYLPTSVIGLIPSDLLHHLHHCTPRQSHLAAFFVTFADDSDLLHNPYNLSAVTIT